MVSEVRAECESLENNKKQQNITKHNVPSNYYIYNRVQKILEKLCKLRKSCKHKWSINGIYNKKLPHKCLQQLPTLRS